MSNTSFYVILMLAMVVSQISGAPVESTTTEDTTGGIQWVPKGVELNNSAWKFVSPDMATEDPVTVSPWKYNFEITLDDKARELLLSQGLDPEATLKAYLDRMGPIPPAPPVGYKTWGLYCRFSNPYHRNCTPLYKDFLQKYFFGSSITGQDLARKVESMLNGDRIILVHTLYSLPRFHTFLDCEATFHHPQDNIRFERMC